MKMYAPSRFKVNTNLHRCAKASADMLIVCALFAVAFSLGYGFAATLF